MGERQFNAKSLGSLLTPMIYCGGEKEVSGFARRDKHSPTIESLKPTTTWSRLSLHFWNGSGWNQTEADSRCEHRKGILLHVSSLLTQNQGLTQTCIMAYLRGDLESASTKHHVSLYSCATYKLTHTPHSAGMPQRDTTHTSQRCIFTMTSCRITRSCACSALLSCCCTFPCRGRDQRRMI